MNNEGINLDDILGNISNVIDDLDGDIVNIQSSNGEM